MLKLFGFILNIFLIFIVFVRVPEDSVGLSSFDSKGNLLGSPRSARLFLDFLIAIGSLVYLVIAFKLNLLTI